MGVKTLCKRQIHLLSCFTLQRVLTGHFGCCGNSHVWHLCFPIIQALSQRKLNQKSNENSSFNHYFKCVSFSLLLKGQMATNFFLMCILYFSIFTRHVCFYPPHIFPNLFGWHLGLLFCSALIYFQQEEKMKSSRFLMCSIWI